jgi:hypothetical protein
MFDLFNITTSIIVPLHHTGDLRKWAIVEEKRERIGRKREERNVAKCKVFGGKES